jgi:hypothetical protein
MGTRSMNHRRFSLAALTLLICACSTPAPSRAPDSEARSDFLSLCSSFASAQGADAAFCSRLNSKFFAETQKGAAVALVNPSDVGAPVMSVDSKVRFVVFHDPNYFPGVAYCYFAYRSWIDPQKMSPDAVALASSGFSILNENIEAYQTWLDVNPEGRRCRELVQKESGVPVTDLRPLLKEHAALVGLNPLASVKNGHLSYQAVIDDLKLTLNHERIHAYQVLCPELEKWGQKMWSALPQEEQDKFGIVYPAYNWKDPKVAGREYVAFSFENKPLRISDHVGNCKVK